MIKPQQAVLLATLLLLGSCRIFITSPEGGSVQGAANGFVCEPGEECELELDGSEPYAQTFQAVPDENYWFTGWRTGFSYLCAGSTDDCSIALPAEPWVGWDFDFYLEPEFRAIPAERTAMPELPGVGDSSFNLSWAPSRTGACVIGENVSPSVAVATEHLLEYPGNRVIYEPAIVFADEAFTMMVKYDGREESTLPLLSAVGDWSDPFITEGEGEGEDGATTLYDDGTHGDLVAGDGIYTHACLSIAPHLHPFDADDLGAQHDLFVVPTELRGTESVTDIATGVQMNAYGVFISVGDAYRTAMAKGRHWDLFNPYVCWACHYAWYLFGDVFDFFMTQPREAFAGAGYTRVHDFIKGTGHAPPHANNSYWEEPMIDGREHPEYIGMVWQGWPTGGGGTHELAHGLLGINTENFPAEGDGQWNEGDGAHIDSTNTINGDLQGAPWDPVRGWPYPVKIDQGGDEYWNFPDAYLERDAEGVVQLKSFDVVNRRWSDIFLYMMGLIDAEDSNETYLKLINPDYGECLRTEYYYVCDEGPVSYCKYPVK